MKHQYQSPILLFACLFFVINFAFAQQYTVSSPGSCTTYAPTDPGVVVDTTFGTIDDAVYTLDLPFTFSFFIQDYTQVYWTTNGYLAFSPTRGDDWSNDPIPSTRTPNNMIAGMWDDITATSMTVMEVGTAPNRTMVYDFVGEYWPSLGGDLLHFQIHLEEGTNIIRTICINCQPESGSQTTTVGIENQDGTFGYQTESGTLSDTSFCYEYTPELFANTPATPPGSYTVDDQCTTAFEDISTTGTGLNQSDDDFDIVNLPFDFSYFGTAYTTPGISISSNGYLGINTTTSMTDFSNESLPDIDKERVICPFWDDLNPAVNGDVYWEIRGTAPNRRFIAQWHLLPHFSFGGTVILQAVLYEGTNEIAFVYDDVFFGSATYDYGASATIGLQDNPPGNFIQYSLNSPSLTSVDCIRFTPTNCSTCCPGDALVNIITACDTALKLFPALSNSGTSLVNDYNNTADASDVYPIGTTTVTFTDLQNNTSCTFDVTVTGGVGPDDTKVLPAHICSGGSVDLASLVRDYSLQAQYFRFYDTNPYANPGATPIASVRAFRGTPFPGSRVMVSPPVTTSYWVECVGAPSGPCGAYTGFPVTVSSCLLASKAAIKLEGAYDATSGLMRNSLVQSQLLPAIEPYTAMGYSFVNGGGGEVVSSSALNQTGDLAVVDWVVLELRDASDPKQIISSRSALLLANGFVVDVDGHSVPEMQGNDPRGQYYVAVVHRNHLAVMTANPVNTGEGMINFSDTNTAIFGSGAMRQLNNQRLMWAGDADGSGQIQNTDDILEWAPNAGTSGYQNADFNLDGQVQNTDRINLWMKNVGMGSQVPK